MMISEFIERTGFEPTAEEYEIIEEEYMGGADDKDTFCKNWKKNGGVQRLTRARKTRIENLESHVDVLEREKEYIINERNKLRNVFNDAKKMVNDLENDNESLKASLETLSEADKQWRKMVADLEAQLAEYKKAEEQLKAVKNLIAVLSN